MGSSKYCSNDLISGDDEVMDLVSLNDEIIGQEKRSIIRSKGLSSFRVINGFICNSKKQLWIPRRHPAKKLFPLHLDASVGGHVIAGESYQEAFSRETSEELNLNLSDYHHYPLARLTPQTHGTSAFMWVYIIESDKAPNYNTNDFVEYFWIRPEEFFAKLSEGDKAKSDLPIILREIADKL